MWEENWAALMLFIDNCTQWRIGANGPSGLDYNVIYHELDRSGLTKVEYDAMMAKIKVIESQALIEIHKA